MPLMNSKIANYIIAIKKQSNFSIQELINFLEANNIQIVLAYKSINIVNINCDNIDKLDKISEYLTIEPIIERTYNV